MYIDGKIQRVLECPYKQGEMWCELDLETDNQGMYTVMVPSEIYKTTRKEYLREGTSVHIYGNVIESSQFVVAWHVSLVKGYSQKLILEN